MKYRILKGYKYDLVDQFMVHTKIKDFHITTPWFVLHHSGMLTIYPHYAWDGATDPAFDTKNFMVGSLVHDVLYQAMREKHLPLTQRKAVDKELRRICLEQGMNPIRAWYVYNFVRIMGKRYALPEKKKRGKVVEV